MERFALSNSKSLVEVCTQLIDLFGMQPLGGTEHPTDQFLHTLKLSGLVAGGGKVLAQCRMTYSPSRGVALELGVRAEAEKDAQLLLGAL